MKSTKVREIDRLACANIAQQCGRISGENLKETAPGGVCAPYAEGLDANKERRMANRSKLRSEERVNITREYLTLAQADLEKARRTRLHYARLGRQYGMTYTELSDALGMSVSSARMMLTRHPDGGE